MLPSRKEQEKKHLLTFRLLPVPSVGQIQWEARARNAKRYIVHLPQPTEFQSQAQKGCGKEVGLSSITGLPFKHSLYAQGAKHPGICG
jgi:hypothetical protein